MMTPVPPIECVRARESASELLDDELPELDATRLDWHLRSCAGCRAYAAQLRALAVAVRTAPAESPERPVQVAPARRRRPAFRLQTTAAAILVVGVASASSFALGSALGTGGSSAPRTSAAAELQNVQADAAQQHLLAMVGRLEFGGFVNAVPRTSGFRPV